MIPMPEIPGIGIFRRFLRYRSAKIGLNWSGGEGVKRRYLQWGFIAYCVLMILLLFARPHYMVAEDYWQQVTMNVNLRPMQTVFRYLRLLNGDYSAYLRRHAAANLIGNVVMFAPLGIFLPLLWSGFRPMWKCLLWCAGIIGSIELLQLVTLVGKCDVDDLLLNLFGIACGYLIYRLFRTIIP